MTDPTPPWVEPPPTPGPTSEERTWAMASHLGVLVAAWFALGFLAPLLVLLTKGDKPGFVRTHAMESLNFQLTLLIYLLACGILVFVFLIGLVLLVILGIFALVVILVASSRAGNGQLYRYPLTIRFIS